jgi:predicted transglutaminase-like cysteine proteinase
MRIRASITSAVAGAILGVLAGNVGVDAASGRAFMVTAGQTAQPIGHYEFCRRFADECVERSSEGSRIRLTPAAWNELVAVNASVNLTIKAVTDDEIFGRPEYWAYPDMAGDCEDLVLLKRRTLIEKGWPTGALLITVVRQTNGEGHAVLTVLTDRGDLILDNLEPRILVWNETDYAYVKRQSETFSGAWMAIDDARMTSVGSTR